MLELGFYWIGGVEMGMLSGQRAGVVAVSSEKATMKLIGNLKWGVGEAKRGVSIADVVGV